MPLKRSIDEIYDNYEQDYQNLEIDQGPVVTLEYNEDPESNHSPLSNQDGEARAAWIERQIENDEHDRICTTPTSSDGEEEEEEYVPVPDDEQDENVLFNEELDAQIIFDIVESFQGLNPNIDFHSLDIGQFMLEQGLHPWDPMDQEIVRQFLTDINELDQEQNQ